MHTTIRSAILCLAVAILTACASGPVSPLVPPSGGTVGIIAATQPAGTVELLAGYIPAGRCLASNETLLEFDAQTTLLLKQNADPSRSFIALPSSALRSSANKGAGHSSALEHWTDVGRKAKVDLLIVPQILNWEERQGGSVGVQTSASVFIQFFLIDVASGSILSRSVTREKQESLSGDLLKIGTFLKRGGKWLTAQELANEGILTMVKEFGL